MYTFRAEIQIIGINPYVSVPEDILAAIFKDAGKEKGTIPIKGTVNEKAFRQTLVRYSCAWRLYINTAMLKNSPKRIGEWVDIMVEFDPEEREIPMPPKLLKALEANSTAQTIFNSLPPSRKLEIVRYLSFLKTEASVDRNVAKIMDYLEGRGRFAGRERI